MNKRLTFKQCKTVQIFCWFGKPYGNDVHSIQISPIESITFRVHTVLYNSLRQPWVHILNSATTSFTFISATQNSPTHIFNIRSSINKKTTIKIWDDITDFESIEGEKLILFDSKKKWKHVNEIAAKKSF
jgi:hypothetical protein